MYKYFYYINKNSKIKNNLLQYLDKKYIDDGINKYTNNKRDFS